MQGDELKDNLEEIENVSVAMERGAIFVTTALTGYEARITLDEVAGYENIISPYMQDCTKDRSD